MTTQEAWQDRDSKNRKEKCCGCDYLAERIQVREWEEDGCRLKAKPEKVMHCYCKYHELHLEYIDRIYEKDKWCLHFSNC